MHLDLKEQHCEEESIEEITLSDDNLHTVIQITI